MVDAACSEIIRLERVERAVFRKANTGGIVGVFQETGVREDSIDFIVLVYIEVTSDEHRRALGYLAHTLHHQFGRLTTCHHTHMIHVEVEEIEDLRVFLSPIEKAATLLFLLFHGKLAPSADADTDGIPAKTWLVGRLAQPEITVVEQLEFVRLIKNGLVFAAAYAVVATDADVVVAVETFLEITKLGIKHLLRAEDVGRHEVQLVTDDLAAFGPHLALDAVVGVLITDVVGADEHLLGGKL